MGEFLFLLDGDGQGRFCDAALAVRSCIGENVGSSSTGVHPIGAAAVVGNDGTAACNVVPVGVRRENANICGVKAPVQGDGVGDVHTALSFVLKGDLRGTIVLGHRVIQLVRQRITLGLTICRVIEGEGRSN